jgi:ribosome-binding factor A
MREKTPGPSRRLERIASRIKFLISQVIQRELNDPRIGFITVLDVEPTADVKEAKVYVSVLGKPGARSKAEHALQGAKGFIQKEVGRGLQTRNTPILRFIFDDSRDKVSRIEALIQKASQEDRETTMAKKPSRKSNKPGRGGEKPGKKPAKKGGSVDDEEEGDDEGKDSEYEAKSDEENGEDFESDFEGEEEEDEDEEEQDEADVNYEDFDEEYVEDEEDDEEEDDDEEDYEDGEEEGEEEGGEYEDDR